MKTTNLAIILDRSGSMASMVDDVKGGFDTFMLDQQKYPEPCFVTLVQFDHEGIDTVYSRTPLLNVPKLVLVPRGGTPLLDAIGKTITELLVKENKAEQYMIVIITDGAENSSREWKKDGVKKLIEERIAAGWKIVYLGANVDAFGEAAAMGILAGSTAGYTNTTLPQAFGAISHNVATYRSTSAAPDFSKDQLDLLSGINLTNKTP